MCHGEQPAVCVMDKLVNRVCHRLAISNDLTGQMLAKHVARLRIVECNHGQAGGERLREHESLSFCYRGKDEDVSRGIKQWDLAVLDRAREMNNQPLPESRIL